MTVNEQKTYDALTIEKQAEHDGLSSQAKKKAFLKAEAVVVIPAKSKGARNTNMKASEQTFIFKPDQREVTKFKSQMLRASKEELEGEVLYFQGVFHKGLPAKGFATKEDDAKAIDESVLFQTSVKYTNDRMKSYYIPIKSFMNSDRTENTVGIYDESTREVDTLTMVAEAMDDMYEKDVEAAADADKESVTIKFPKKINIRLVADLKVPSTDGGVVSRWPAYEYTKIVEGLKAINAEHAPAAPGDTEDPRGEATTNFYREHARDIYAEGKKGLLKVYQTESKAVKLPETLKTLVIAIL